MHIGSMQQHQRASSTLNGLKLTEVILWGGPIKAHTTLRQPHEAPCRALLVHPLEAPQTAIAAGGILQREPQPNAAWGVGVQEGAVLMRHLSGRVLHGTNVLQVF